MNRDDAIKAAWDWIVRTHGAEAEGLRILTDDVVLVRGQWHVPYDAIDDVLVPLPAVEVPDDGGEPHAFEHTGAPSPWLKGVPSPGPGPDLAVVDPEWDQETFAHLGVPRAAILGWVRAPGSDEFRHNPEYKPGPARRGWPAPQTPADKIVTYYHCEWLDEDPALMAGFLDVVLYVRHNQVVHEEEGRTWLAAYSSELRLPKFTHQWREIGVRELLRTMEADEVRINPGFPLEARLYKEVADSLDQWPEPFPLPPATDGRMREFEDEWTDRMNAAAEATGAELHLSKVKAARVELFEKIEAARANGLAYTDAERELLADAILWNSTGRKGPAPAGKYVTDIEGQRHWDLPTFGKAFGNEHNGEWPHGWPWVVGVYAGFMLGEFLVDRAIPLTVGLTRLTDHLAHAVYSRGKDRLEWPEDEAPPVPEVRALVAAIGSGHPAVANSGWDNQISPVFDRAMSSELFSRATGTVLHEVGLDLPDQGTPWGQAVRIASSLGHDPAAAFDAAVPLGPLTAALTGALVGAWHGLPGVQSVREQANFELAEQYGDKAFWAFLAPGPPKHPGLPPVTDGMRAEAAQFPGGWLYCADPELDPRYIEGVPLETLFGAYEVGPDGQLTGKEWINDDYKPGPRRMGLPEPANPFEEILNLVTAGWLPYEAILPVSLDTEFWVHTAPDGAPAVFQDSQGNRVLAVYSSEHYSPADAGTPAQMSLRSLLSVLPELMVLVNPGGKVGADIRGEHLVQVAST